MDLFNIQEGKNEHESICRKDFLFKNVGKLTKDVEVLH